MELLLSWMLIASVQLAATMSPGPAFVMAMKYVLSYNRIVAVFFALGLALGVAAHVIFVLAGISFLIAQSVFLYSVIKYVGAAYLIYIGLKSLQATKKKPQTEVASEVLVESKSLFSAVLNGFLTNLLNPKAVIFFTAVFTQFIDPTTPFHVLMLYGATSIFIEFSWFAFLAIILTNPSIKKRFMKFMKWVEGLCGGLMVALGVKLALSKA